MKKALKEFTETEISPDIFIYSGDNYFLTIEVTDNKTILSIEDAELSFPFNKLNIETMPFDKISKDIVPDNIVLDFSFMEDLNFENWSHGKNFLENNNFKLFKRESNNILFYSIVTDYVFDNYNDFILQLNKTLNGRK